MFLEPVVKPNSVCKCCQGPAELFGVCDFNKNCEERRGLFLPLSGIPVYYYRCNNCGFIFTDLMDGADEEDFARLIYNKDYINVDPDYVEQRPQFLANIIVNTFNEFKNRISILDYGGGSGRLAQLLYEQGFKSIEVFDSYTPAFASKPDRRFNLILCFEVFEHVCDPSWLVADIANFMDEQRGFAVFSTAIQPQEIEKIRTSWWYISPRNGHISIHTAKSLGTIHQQNGLNLASMDTGFHFAYRSIPDFAQTIFKQA